MKNSNTTSIYLALTGIIMFLVPRNSFEQTGMPFLRTPDSYFSNLPGYSFTPHYVYVDDTKGGQLRMHYLDEGPIAAPTILMLHGNPTWSYMFRDVIVRLNKAGYRTIAVDYIGMGRSDKPVNFNDYSYDRHVYWTAQIFKHLDSSLNLGSVVIFGHDYGTPIGIRLMNEYFPNRFDGFIDANASLPDGTYISPTHLNWRQFVRDNPDVPVGHVISNNVNPPLSQNEILAYYAPFPNSTYKMAVRSFPEMVPEDTTWSEAIANKAAWNYLKSFNKPFMTIFGQFDAVNIPSARMDFINRVPGAYGQPHPQLNVTHYAPEDKPDEVADEILDFLADLYHPNHYQNIVFNEFNFGFDSLVDGGNNCEWDKTLKSIKLSSNNGSSSSTWLANPIDLTNKKSVKISFKYVTNGMENGEKFHVEFWDGNTWRTIHTLIAGTDFVNGAFDYGYIKISNDSIDFSENSNIRIRCEASDNSDIVHVMDIGIYTRDVAFVGNADTPQETQDFLIYPNPTQNLISIKNYPSCFEEYLIFNQQGRMVLTGKLNLNNTEVSIAGFSEGLYFLGLKSKVGIISTKRIIKK